jgi:hypothetical protein
MLTRALFLVLLICGVASPALAEETKVLALGLADHEVTQEELNKGTPPVPGFNSPAIAYVSAANLKKGDGVEITLSNSDKPLLTNSETLAEDKATYLLQAGKRGVPAGGWPSEWSYFAKLKITRDGKTLIEQATAPIPFE